MVRLVDRENEIRNLRELAAREGRHIALLYGRRRIGKTFLLTNAWKDKDQVFYYTASATAPEINRRALLQEAARWSGSELHEADHPTWRTLFRTLFELHPGRPLIIVLDEFQYLASTDNGLREVASELNAIWESDLRRTGNLLLVLSGSAVHTLRALESGGSPLFGRLDWRRRLTAFDYLDAGEMVPRYGPRDRILTYAAFGGTPQYLDAVDDSIPLADNIIDLLLSPDGRVRLQVETALEQEEGLRDVARYRAILAAIGLKRRAGGEIAADLGQASDTPLKRMVKELVRLEYLEEERNFNAPRNQAIRYRLADPAQRFYYGFVLSNESAIASAGPRPVWDQRLAPELWPTYVGRQVFEDVVRQAYLRPNPHRECPEVEEWGRWGGWDRKHQPVEIDIVARLLDGRMLTGAVKFQTRAAGARLFLDHMQTLERLAISGQSWAREALAPDACFIFASAAGFRDTFQAIVQEQDDRSIIAWALNDLYAPNRIREPSP